MVTADSQAALSVTSRTPKARATGAMALPAMEIDWPTRNHRKAAERSGCPEARPVGYRYASLNGVPDHLLALWAGHTNVKTTKRWYVKPNVEDLRPAADTWGGLASSPDPLP
ncbi:hypothetical protein SLUN_32100 [Streptomyces lunaelactis]|uniref:Tyr recombinase domain-containing protein n=1 Tax=Streptomyces lunaelactis TaxID=1535768 RepID=A0A2R4TAK6_9ACTN|nr:hypothetical protein SLUN_32100 [Streptomyces lunaelactis]